MPERRGHIVSTVRGGEMRIMSRRWVPGTTGRPRIPRHRFAADRVACSMRSPFSAHGVYGSLNNVWCCCLNTMRPAMRSPRLQRAIPPMPLGG